MTTQRTMSRLTRARGRRMMGFLPRAAAAVITAVALAAGAGALSPAAAAVAAHPDSAAAPTVPHPRLTTDTPAGCNRAERPGVARCFAIVRTPSDRVITADSSGPPSTALGPADIQSAYSLPSATAGKGQTVAVVDAMDDSTAEADLAAFRSQYGLPPCTTANGCFTKVNQEGKPGPYPPNAPGGNWALEISLDLDAVSSACPNCHILLVEANSASNTDLGKSVDTAVQLGAAAVSNSYGDFGHPGESRSEIRLDQYYKHPGVAVTASAGDGGYGANYPSASQYVTAVGGTSLTKDSSVPRGWDETVWNDLAQGDGATGSGCSAYEPRPSWQAGITRDCPMRATADVSADADPDTGLAVYDTDGEGGWLQVGGTSLSSPLIAATFALAGKPASGTYPSSYLYAHYLAHPHVFNDITSGSDGACGNVLCTAGPGWDGPTGVGTPDGVSGFTHVPTGSVTGMVTDTTSGKPIAGASVSIPRLRLTTGSDGTYTLAGLPPGSYRMRVSGYGYRAQTQTVTVTAGQATTENFKLTLLPRETLSGAVTAATGNAWPLYAKITWSTGHGQSGTAYTTPATGKYSLSLVDKSFYRLTVRPLYPGYTTPAVTIVRVGTGNVTHNFTADVDTVACTALGYRPVLSGATQPFTGPTAPNGWTVTNINLHYTGYTYTPGWVFTNPGKRANHTGGAGNFAIVDSDHDGQFHYQDTYLTTPVQNFTADKSPAVQFGTDLAGATNSTATVGLSVNGGQTWATVWRNTGAAGDPGPATVVVPLPTAAGKSDVRVRFGYTGQWSQYWEIDNVFLGNRICSQRSGAVLTGKVTSANGTPVNGAAITSAHGPSPAAVTSGGGLYTLFTTATGRQRFTASAAGYTSSTRTATLTTGRVSTLNFTLTASS